MTSILEKGGTVKRIDNPSVQPVSTPGPFSPSPANSLSLIATNIPLELIAEIAKNRMYEREFEVIILESHEFEEEKKSKEEKEHEQFEEEVSRFISALNTMESFFDVNKS